MVGHFHLSDLGSKQTTSVRVVPKYDHRSKRARFFHWWSLYQLYTVTKFPIGPRLCV